MSVPPAEQIDLLTDDKVIRTGRQSFVDVGLAQIRDPRLDREEFDCLEEYGRKN